MKNYGVEDSTVFVKDLNYKVNFLEVSVCESGNFIANYTAIDYPAFDYMPKCPITIHAGEDDKYELTGSITHRRDYGFIFGTIKTEGTPNE